MSERDENNRKLAEWLGWTYREWKEFTQDGNERFCRWEKPIGCKLEWDFNYPPDFYTSEEANALLLEKMRRPLLVSDWPGCEGWRVDIGVEELPRDPYFPNASGGKPIGPTCTDRKTAICKAALALIEKEPQCK